MTAFVDSSLPGIDDLARLVLRRCYERILYGEAEVTPGMPRRS
jgi:hypothetical protein